jgi:hypothetical protein
MGELIKKEKSSIVVYTFAAFSYRHSFVKGITSRAEFALLLLAFEPLYSAPFMIALRFPGKRFMVLNCFRVIGSTFRIGLSLLRCTVGPARKVSVFIAIQMGC